MSKYDLLARLWRDTFVFEKNLANLVGEVRDAWRHTTGAGVRPQRSSLWLCIPRTAGQACYQFARRSRHPSIPPRLAEGRATLHDGEYVLGRDRDVELFIDSPSVSRRHAPIRVSGSTATIEDLGSKNGTFVGDHRLESATGLSDGDRIAVGSVKLTFLHSGARLDRHGIGAEMTCAG